MSIRVAMVGLRAPWGTEGGVEAAVGHLAPRLVERGCAVTVYCRRRYNSLGPGVHHGVRLVDVDTVYSKHLEAIVHTALVAPRAALRADIVHIHATGPGLLSWVPRLARRTTVLTLHGLDWQREKWGAAARTVLQAGAWSSATFPHRLIAVGDHLRAHYAAQYGVNPTVIPNGVTAIARQPLSVSGVPDLVERQYLLFVGRLVPEKGLERLFSAYEASGIQMPLVVAGGSTHMADYQQRLARMAPKGVRLVGPRYAEARDALLSHARAFVLPSTLEGFPLAALEAMASGLPVLLSDIPPHHELLNGGELSAGWIVDDRKWAAALRRIQDTPWTELSAMGQVGNVHVARHHSWDRVAEQTMTVYTDALKSRKSVVH